MIREECIICIEKQNKFRNCPKCSQRFCVECYDKHKLSRKDFDGIVKCMFCNEVLGPC